jgi:hypothetical protein
VCFKSAGECNYILEVAKEQAIFANLDHFRDVLVRTMKDTFGTTADYAISVSAKYIYLKCAECKKFQIWFSYKGSQ